MTTTTDTPSTDADLMREAKIVKLTKQNYHGLAKTKAAWYETMKKIRGIYEETETPRTDAEIWDVVYHHKNEIVVDADFARELEREFAEARAEVERLRTALQSCWWATNTYDGNYTRACDDVATIAINALKPQDK